MRTKLTLRAAAVIGGIILALVGIARAEPVAPVKLGIVVLPEEAMQIEYSPGYGLLFVRNSDNDIRVIDTTTNAQIDLRAGNDQFNDLDLTPDEHYLYAAGYSQPPSGDPIRPYVHRFDLVTRTWDTCESYNPAYRIEGVDADRFLIQEQRQHPDLTFNRFAPTIVQLDRVSSSNQGDFKYDHATDRVIHGNSGSSSKEIHSWRIMGDTLEYQETAYDSADIGGGTAVLSTDFQHFYYGRLQVNAQNVKQNLTFFPENIYAASSDIAFGESNYYDAETGGELGSLGFNSKVYGISGDGRELWAYRSFGNVLFHYDLVPEPATMSMLALGGLVVWWRRRRNQTITTEY